MSTREQLEQAIAHLETQRAILGDAVVDVAIGSMQQQLTELERAEREATPASKSERKLVTVMFADISGFTGLTETMDPEVVRDLINACFEQLVPIIEKYGGTVDKFIGDEIMALFGAPIAHEDDPERALHAAIEMMDALSEFNVEQSTDLGLHFGINTGLVIAGALGTRERRGYSVMGDAVNLASRLEDVSERGDIFVGPDTYRLTAPLFEFEALEPIQVKGKTDPVQVYRLLGTKAAPDRVRGIVGLESPLVGRKAEFRALQEAVDQVRAGVGGIVTLVGEAGLGKSRLVAEIRELQFGPTAAVGIRNFSWVEGRCMSYGGSIAYLLWIDVLRGLLEVTVEDPPLAVRDALRERVQALCPECFEDVYPYLGRLLSLPLTDEYETRLQNLDGETRKRYTFRAVERLIESAARQQPLVVVCEDLHWADPTSIDLLEQLLGLSNRVPLLLINILRAEKEHGCWRIKKAAAQPSRHRHTDLWLEPFSTADSKALLDNLLRTQALPYELRERILGRAEGNPFYVEEIIRSLIDSKAIAYDEANGRWQATRDVSNVAIPDTLHGVLMARIDRLQEETKRVLQMASVIGRIFFYRVLAEIAREERKLDDPTLWNHLLTLQREEMIREQVQVSKLAHALGRAYIFGHDLTREAAYNGLLKKERRVFHRQVAEALEHIFPERVEEQAGLLAHHWERAEEPEKATEYLLRAGDQARMAYAHQEAVDYYQRALVFMVGQGEPGQKARTLMKLGLTYYTAFDFQRSRQAYEQGFALWQKVGEARREILQPAPHALRMAWGDPLTLDPTLVGEINSAYVICQLFSGLVDLSPEVSVVPDVAHSWQVLEGGRKFVFYLRDDVQWSDGRAVTAGDFEYTWKRVLDPVTGATSVNRLYDLKGAKDFHQGRGTADEIGVQALDDVTLAVELEAPTGYFLHMLTNIAYYPIPRHVVDARGEAWTKIGNIVTNGPFVLNAWQRGDLMVFARNPAYHGSFTGNLERVELAFNVADPYARDDLDIVTVQPLMVDRARQSLTDAHISFSNPQVEVVGFDVSRPPFDDPRVRQAFAMAVDKETLADVVLKGHVSPARGGFVPPGIPGHSAEIGQPYDPARARKLLAQAGYPGGRVFPSVNLLTRMIREPRVEYLQTQWRENLGVEITWERMSFRLLFDRLRSKPPHIFLVAWTADYPDPDNFLRVSETWQHTRWQNDTFDRLVAEARRVMDQEKRMKLYRQADRILMEEAVIVPLYYRRANLLVKPWVSKLPTPVIGWPRWKDIIIEQH